MSLPVSRAHEIFFGATLAAHGQRCELNEFSSKGETVTPHPEKRNAASEVRYEDKEL